MTHAHDIWVCNHCTNPKGRHDLYFDGICEKCHDKLLKIDSSYYNEHTKELQLYIGDKLHCTITCLNEPTEEEIEDIISDIEWEENKHITQPHLIQLIKKN